MAVELEYRNAQVTDLVYKIFMRTPKLVSPTRAAPGYCVKKLQGVVKWGTCTWLCSGDITTHSYAIYISVASQFQNHMASFSQNWKFPECVTV